MFNDDDIESNADDDFDDGGWGHPGGRAQRIAAQQNDIINIGQRNPGRNDPGRFLDYRHVERNVPPAGAVSVDWTEEEAEV